MLNVTVKSLLSRKLRLVLTALSITLGVAFVAGTFVLTDTMNRTFDQLFTGLAKGTDVKVRAVSTFDNAASMNDLKPIPASLVDSVRDVPGVAKANGSLTGYALMLDKDGKPIQPNGAPTLGSGFADDTDLAGGFTLRDGKAPAADGDVVIDAATAKKYGYHVGDQIRIVFSSGPSAFTVSGIAGFGDADNLAGATLASFTNPVAQRVLGKPASFDEIAVQAAKGVSPEELRDRLNAALPQGIEAVTSATAIDESSKAVAKELGFFSTVLLVFAAIALLVGSFIIWNTFSILVAQRTRELALLRAVGARRAQVMRSVLVEASVVGLIASAAGLGLGIAVAAGLRALLHAVGIDVPTTTLVVEPRTIIASFVVGTLITLAASLAPARKATKVAPIEALRDAAPGAGRVSRARLVTGAALAVVGVLTLASGLFGGGGIALVGLGVLATFLGVTTLAPVAARPLARVIGSPLRGMAGSLARENAMRNPKRTAATASALMIGLALVASVTVVASSMKASVSDVLDRVNRADLVVKPSNPMAPGLSPAAASALRELPGVATVSEMRYATARVDGKTTMAFGLDPATIEKVSDLGMRSGSVAALADGGMLVSEKVAKAEGWHVGDVVTVEFPQTGVQQVPVVGVHTAEAALGSDYVVSLDTLARNVTTQLDAVVLVKLAPGAAVDTTKASAEAALTTLGGAKVDDASGFKKDAQAKFDQLLGVVTVLLLLAVIIALLGIVNTLALSVFERTRELGLLRAVGMTRRQVRAVIRWEAVIIAVLGAALGIALGIGFGVALSRALADQGVTALQLPAGQLAVYVMFAGLAGVIAAIAPARRAARVDVLRAVTDG